jgi:hypothetical protein
MLPGMTEFLKSLWFLIIELLVKCTYLGKTNFILIGEVFLVVVFAGEAEVTQFEAPYFQREPGGH